MHGGEKEERLGLRRSLVGLVLIVAAAPTLAQEISLSLADAIRIAKERSFSIARAERGVESAQSQYRVTKAALLPRFDSNVAVIQNGTTATGDNVSGLKPEFSSSLGLTIAQTVDIGGVIGRKIRQSELQRSTSEQSLAQSVLDVSLDVENVYIDALRSQETVRIDEATVADLRALIETVKKAKLPSVGFLEVELANAQQTLAGSETALDLSTDNLKQTLRLDPASTVRLTDKLTYDHLQLDQESALKIALANRPEIKQAEMQLEQAKVAVDAAGDSRKPTLSVLAFSNDSILGSNPGQAIDNPNSYGRGVSAILNIPLAYYDWGVLNETKRQAILALDQAQADLAELRERVGLEIRQSMIALMRAEQRIKTLPDREQAQQALKEAEASFLIDPSNLAQSSVARSNLYLAETASVDAYSDYNQAVFRLKRSMGVPNDAKVSAATLASAVRNSEAAVNVQEGGR
jgi:outer membrane protein TolC